MYPTVWGFCLKKTWWSVSVPEKHCSIILSLKLNCPPAHYPATHDRKKQTVLTRWVKRAFYTHRACHLHITKHSKLHSTTSRKVIPLAWLTNASTRNTEPWVPTTSTVTWRTSH